MLQACTIFDDHLKIPRICVGNILRSYVNGYFHNYLNYRSPRRHSRSCLQKMYETSHYCLQFDKGCISNMPHVFNDSFNCRIGALELLHLLQKRTLKVQRSSASITLFPTYLYVSKSNRTKRKARISIEKTSIHFFIVQCTYIYSIQANPPSSLLTQNRK